MFPIGFEREKVGQLEDSEPIVPFRSWGSGPRLEASEARDHANRRADQIAFDRRELNIILGVYGTRVAAGEWRDYALDFGRDKATFSIFRRASEVPLYRTSGRRSPRRASMREGPGGYPKRCQDLDRVLRVLLRQPHSPRLNENAGRCGHLNCFVRPVNCGCRQSGGSSGTGE